MKFITVPAGRFAAEEDAAAAKRREIAERLKRGESVNVTPSGQIVEPNDSQAQLKKNRITMLASSISLMKSFPKKSY